LAGGAYAWNLSVFYPEAVFTLQISVFAIVFSLFGGVGTVIGPIIGAGVLYSLYSAIGISEPQYFQLIYGGLIVLLVLFMPGGVLSLLTRRGVRVF
jgi:branched-chain amino acid transport system permease protein